ncbi:MAG: prepilin-type N-terminal cleavage/methylation domain-containing protein [Endomicrobiia bacterium]|nr:prepilin-type N-terminal cleavage/methylation domain-containing protein [Endomicrobiaceae bacterium]MDD3922428.1 prepilin-type N-terminal cleavage/methylation domain-containing protein [Endomicrobiaceae bacterium]MDD5102383.1 prepilin-type N-terminal cleavage/methylation domain-containing protein [Endomicrobiaceae bacterium]
MGQFFKNFYKINLGLTLIEVLVSVVITSMVMVYGMSFFMAAWRMEVESSNYSRILGNVAKIIEDNRSEYYSIVPPSGTVTISSEALPSGKVVMYSYTFSRNIVTNSMQGVALAEWPWTSSASAAEKASWSRISIKTHFAEEWKK